MVVTIASQIQKLKSTLNAKSTRQLQLLQECIVHALNGQPLSCIDKAFPTIVELYHQRYTLYMMTAMPRTSHTFKTLHTPKITQFVLPKPEIPHVSVTENIGQYFPPLRRENTLTKPSFVCIDSQTKSDSETAYSFRYRLLRPINWVYEIQLETLEFRNNQYTVYDGNNVLYFQEVDGTTLSATIPIGNYTLSTLLTALQTALNTVGSAHYTASVSASGYVVLSSDLTGSSGPVLFTLQTSQCVDLARLLGFSFTNLSGSASYTAPNLNTVEYESTSLILYLNTIPIIVPISNHTTTFVSYQQLNNFKIEYPEMTTLNEIQIELRNPNGTFYQTDTLSATLKVTSAFDTVFTQ